jgi:nitroreductase
MPITAKEFSKFAASRRSTRDFLPKPVDQKLIDQLLTDGMSASSWSNTRPFLFAVASGDKRDRISADLLRRWAALSEARRGGFLAKLKLALTASYAIPLMDYWFSSKYDRTLVPRSQKVGRELYTLLGVPRGDAEARDEQWANNYRFFGAPTVIFVFIHKSLGVYAANDTGLFVQNLMLSAKANGLGTCALGSVTPWPRAIRKEFEIPKDYKMIYGIAVGYPSKSKVNSFKAERISIEEISVK